MADPTDSDETEITHGPAPVDAGDDAGDYTGYQAAAVSASTGFEQARTVALKAQAESCRLLKIRFALENVLGSGGMGVVYKARDPRKV